MVHLWVEGFFEVFATVVIAFLFARLKLVATADGGTRPACSRPRSSWPAASSARCTICTSAARRPWSLALGSVFSALEVVPLLFVGFEAWENLRMSRSRPWVQKYRWPIYFFVSVAFWNLVGAGLFGFMINPPIALYYMQGLNTTPVHAPRRAVRRLRDARHRADALLPARARPRAAVEGRPGEVRVLGHERRAASPWCVSACCRSA